MNNLTDLQNQFKSYTFDSCNKLFEVDYNTIARVVDIYDGDTCTIVFKLNDTYNKFTVRLKSIDTCEIKSQESENKKKAYLARNRLFNLITNLTIHNESRKTIRTILNTNVYLINVCITGTDKYGRLLGNLYNVDDEQKIRSYSSILIEEKLAYTYNGGTKKTEEEQVIDL